MLSVSTAINNSITGIGANNGFICPPIQGDVFSQQKKYIKKKKQRGKVYVKTNHNFILRKGKKTISTLQQFSEQTIKGKSNYYIEYQGYGPFIIIQAIRTTPMCYSNSIVTPIKCDVISGPCQSIIACQGIILDALGMISLTCSNFRAIIKIPIQHILPLCETILKHTIQCGIPFPIPYARLATGDFHIDHQYAHISLWIHNQRDIQHWPSISILVHGKYNKPPQEIIDAYNLAVFKQDVVSQTILHKQIKILNPLCSITIGRNYGSGKPASNIEQEGILLKLMTPYAAGLSVMDTYRLMSKMAIFLEPSDFRDKLLQPLVISKGLCQKILKRAVKHNVFQKDDGVVMKATRCNNKFWQSTLIIKCILIITFFNSLTRVTCCPRQYMQWHNITETKHLIRDYLRQSHPDKLDLPFIYMMSVTCRESLYLNQTYEYEQEWAKLVNYTGPLTVEVDLQLSTGQNVTYKTEKMQSSKV